MPKESSAHPSAPAWQAAEAINPISYPEINLSQQRQEAVGPSRGQQPLAEGENSVDRRAGKDWEPRPEEDWEGVETPQAVPSRGATLMEPNVSSPFPSFLPHISQAHQPWDPTLPSQFLPCN